jgi:hypothetical protein
MYERASGRCEICGRLEDDDCGLLCIDHDHGSGAVRGLLCRKCNAAIGQMGDSVEMLERAIAYLRSRQP